MRWTFASMPFALPTKAIFVYRRALNEAGRAARSSGHRRKDATRRGSREAAFFYAP
jgi:hypothetical protein